MTTGGGSARDVGVPCEDMPASTATHRPVVVGPAERDGGGVERRTRRPLSSSPPHHPKPLSISDFWLGDVIGEGSYGRVCHARLKTKRRGRSGPDMCHSSDGSDREGGGGSDHHRDLAVKMMEKREIAKHGMIRNVMAERDALMSVAIEAQAAEESERDASATKLKSRFVIRLRACFHNDDHLFFVTDLCWETLEDAVAKIHNDERTGKKLIDDGEAGRHRGIGLGLRSDKHEAASSLLGRMARYYVGQILLALEFVHSRGIVHRDLKPSNVLIAPGTGIAKLADFGSSCSFLGSPSGDELAEGEERGIAGTAGYAPPELLSGIDSSSSRSPAVDLWSLGCVAHHVLVGCGSPFETGNECLTVQRIMSYSRGGRGVGTGGCEGCEEEAIPFLPPLAAVESNYDGASSDVIRRLLHPDPASRLGASDVVPVHDFGGGVVGKGRRYGGCHPPAADDTTCYHSIRSHPFFVARGVTDDERGGADHPSESRHDGAGSCSGDWWTMLERGEVRPPYRPDEPRWLPRPQQCDDVSRDGLGVRSFPCMRDGATEFGRWLMENG